MARFLARRQADIYPRAPDPQVLDIDLLSFILGKNPLIPSPTSTTTNESPVTTTLVTNFPVTTTTAVTTGNDGQPTTVIRTNTQTNVVPTTTNGNTPNTSSNTTPNYTTTSPGFNGNGDTDTSTAQDPSVAGGTSMVSSDSASREALKGSFATSKGCASSCDWQSGMSGTRSGSAGVSPTGGTSGGGGSGGDNSNLGALIGGVVGALIGAALLALAIYFLVRRARRRRAAANNAPDDATCLLRDADPFRSGYPRTNRQSRMTIETRHRTPSFGTLYGLRYNPDAAGGSVGNPSHSAPPLIWKAFTPSPPPRIVSGSTICPDAYSGSESHSVDKRSSGERRGVPFPGADIQSILSAENPFSAQTDSDYVNGTPSRGDLDGTHTISHSSGSDYSGSNS